VHASVRRSTGMKVRVTATTIALAGYTAAAALALPGV
jgi:hypothetical protein